MCTRVHLSVHLPFCLSNYYTTHNKQYLFIYVYLHTHTHTHIHTQTLPPSHTHTHTDTPAHTHTHAHTYRPPTHVDIHMHRHTHAYTDKHCRFISKLTQPCLLGDNEILSLTLSRSGISNVTVIYANYVLRHRDLTRLRLMLLHW